MNMVNYLESSPDRLFKYGVDNATVNPNGKLRLIEKNNVPRIQTNLAQAVWQVEPVTPMRKYQESLLSVTPKYPHEIDIYSPGRISLGQTAELCGLFYDEIIQEMKSRGLYLDFGPETLEEAERDLATIRRHLRPRTR